MKLDDMSDTVTMIVMWNENKVTLSAPENQLCKADYVKREWLLEEMSHKFGMKVVVG